MVITLALVSLRNSPGTTLISSTLPASGERTTTSCLKSPGVKPEHGEAPRGLLARGVRLLDVGSVACASALSAVSTSFFATALCSNRSDARSKSACAFADAAWACVTPRLAERKADIAASASGL